MTYLLIFILVVAFIGINSRINKIENGGSKTKNSGDCSYKIDFKIQPNWHEILKKLAKQNKVEVNKFIDEILKDKKLKIQENGGLWDKSFHFVYFHDSISKIQQIWSDYHQTFIDEIEIRGNIFETKDIFGWIGNEKYEDNSIRNTFVIRPTTVGFHSVLPDGDLTENDKLGKIPFWEIINFLISIKDLGVWGPMYKIKKFPPKLESILNENKVKYEDWNIEDYGCGGDASEELLESKNDAEIFDQKMRSQIFSTTYYTLEIRIEIFD